MFQICLPKVYDMVLQTQTSFLQEEPILSLTLQPPYKAVLKKDYLHIYINDEPKLSLAVSFPSLIKWECKEKDIIGFKIQNSNAIYLSDDSRTLKEMLAGKLFFARVQDFYTPLQILGKGSSAKVMLVRHKETEQFFAAKCVEKNELMYQEIEINNKLIHPAFVRVREVYQGETSYYIIMDLLSGKNLQTLLRNSQGLTIEQSRQIMQALLQGLEYMHSQNIMHRDIKPENIVLEKSNQLTTLKIVDFGLATYSNLKKFKYAKCGTPGYVAPEIANLTDKNQTYSSVCDVFSAGVVFYKLLTGRDAFPGTGFNYVLQLNKKCHIDFTALLLKKIPQPVIQLVQSMLNKDPKTRPTASDCLKHEFFQIVEKPSNLHKKQFFLAQKNLTVEFSTPDEKPEYKGSFIINDMVKYPQMPKMVMKFNTTEFEQQE